MTRSRELHIAPGSAASGSLEKAFNFQPGVLLDHQDILSIGPLPPLRSIDEWKSTREAYWRTLDPKYSDFGDFPSFLLTNTQSLIEADSVTLWIGTGLAEQLLLCWLVQLFHLLRIDPAKLRVIQFFQDPIKGYEIQSPGILNPADLKSHPPAVRLDDADLASLDAAWSAVTATEPAELMAFLNDEPGPLPFLQRSFQALRFRFPDADTGLGRWEAELLRQVIEQGPSVLKVIGFTIIRGIDELDWVGDGFLFARLRYLADRTLQQPLISLTGNGANMRECEVHLTETGREVLKGKLNFVTLNGIDDWVCGIHLDSVARRVWFQRDGILTA